MSGVREGSATPNVKGYSIHSTSALRFNYCYCEGSETESRRALSSDGHLARAGLWLVAGKSLRRRSRSQSLVEGEYEEEAPVREVGARTHCVLLAHGR